MKDQKASQPEERRKQESEMIRRFVEAEPTKGWPVEKARRFPGNVLLRVARALRTIDETEPRPSLDVKEKLRLSVKARQYKVKPINRLLGIMNWRIPVYQAALATAVVFMTLSVFSKSGKVRDFWDKSGYPVVSEIPVIDSLYTAQRLHLVRIQKIGRNLNEDSLMVRFVVNSADVF